MKSNLEKIAVMIRDVQAQVHKLADQATERLYAEGIIQDLSDIEIFCHSCTRPVSPFQEDVRRIISANWPPKGESHVTKD